MSLDEYRRKRNFKVTPEPAGERTGRKTSSQLIYVIQKHRATQLHYDFRLEWAGTLLSWAVPKGPSLDPSVKRMAMRGSWVLVRTKGWGANKGKPAWLLIKHRDEYASEIDITEEQPYSAVSGRLLTEIAHDNGGDVLKAATGDPTSAKMIALKKAQATEKAEVKRGATKKKPAKRAAKKMPSIWHSNRPKR